MLVVVLAGCPELPENLSESESSLTSGVVETTEGGFHIGGCRGSAVSAKAYRVWTDATSNGTSALPETATGETEATEPNVPVETMVPNV